MAKAKAKAKSKAGSKKKTAAAKNTSKTRPTGVSVAAYIGAIASAERRKDCKALLELMTDVTGEKPKMWGPSIVGFGSYHYKYESGREGDCCRAGFSSGSGHLTLYATAEAPAVKALLAKLGKHRASKACVYINKLADVDLGVVRQIVAASLAEVKRLHG